MLDSLEEVAAETGFALKLVIYPVLGEKSKTMTAHVICKHLGYGAYKTLKTDDPVQGCKKADQLIGRTFDLLKKADLSFVPWWLPRTAPGWWKAMIYAVSASIWDWIPVPAKKAAAAKRTRIINL